ncbi:MAG TPA: AI-2E family transporter, partial [Algoriphagus sp.]|nr:AI-2E family transporter [Algoriphagus sp.]
MSIKKLEIPTYLSALSVMVFIIVLTFFLIVGKSLLIPLFLGGFFAILFTPFSNWMESKKVPKILSSVISLLCMTLIVGGLLSFIVGNVASFTSDFDDVTSKINTYAQRIDEWTQSTFQMDYEIRNKANTDYLKGVLKENSSSISDFAMKTVGSLSGLVLIPVFMFFFLLY